MNNLQRRRAGLLAALVGLGLAASLALGGCTFFGPTTAAGGGTGGNGQSGQSGDGTDPSESPVDESVVDFDGLPTTFPVADIPIIDGEIPFGVDLGTGWSVLVKVDDTVAAYGEASQKLKDAGFDALAESSSADGSFGVFENAIYRVQLTAADTADYGLSATYLVVIKG